MSRKNDTRFADFLSDTVDALGRTQGEGETSLPKLAIAVAHAARDGYITSEKQGDAPDAAHLIYQRYVDARAAASTAYRTPTAGGFSGNVSKLRAFVKLGEKAKIDGASVLERAREILNDLVDATPDAKLKSPYAYLVDVARRQLETEYELSDADLGEIAAKPVRGEKSRADKLRDAFDALYAIAEDGDDEDRLQDAMELVKGELHAMGELTSVEIAAVKERNKTMAKIAALQAKLAA